MVAWAASGTAAVSGADAKVTVSIEGNHLLELDCNRGVGYKDGFCKPAGLLNGDHLILDFDRGLGDVKFGFQPGSRYVFGDVMFVRNIWNRDLDVFIRVEQEAGGSLYEVLTVDLTFAGEKHRMFPPVDGSDGTDKIITMSPGSEASLSFGIDVDDHWSAHGRTFREGDTRFQLNGAVIVRVGIDSSDDDDTPPGGGGTPPTDDDDTPTGGTDTPPGGGEDTLPDGESPIEQGDEPPLAGPPSEDSQPGPDDPSQPIVIDETPPLAGRLPHTGGSSWPYAGAGLAFLMTGVWLYRRTQQR